MKNYLLTWYGITDLRAALGLDDQGGPVLGALKTGKYSDVMILAYTAPEKASKANEEEQRLWLAEHSIDACSPALRLDRQQELEAVDLFANTAAAHQLYKKWLRTQLDQLGLRVEVKLCIKELGGLNDSKGIYEAASRALNIVSEDQIEKELTFYLSPGTPVMAFMWAFVSMVNPELKITTIACPDFRNPPEEIPLPYELLAPSNRSRKPKDATGVEAFDTVFHLFGEQRLPSLLGIQQFPAKRHIFVCSKRYDAGVMRQFLPKGAEFQQLVVNAFDPMSAKVGILRTVSGLGQGERIGFNLTGGTKLMFAGAIAACRKIGGVPFYFEIRDQSLIYLHDYTTAPIKGIDNVDKFFQLNGFTVVKQGRWDHSEIKKRRVPLTKKLWDERKAIAQLYGQITKHCKYDENDFEPFSIRMNVVDSNNSSIDIEARLDETGKAYMNFGGEEFKYKNCLDFAKYLAGGWLEEYSYLLLEPLLRQGKIRDLRIGLEVSWEDRNRDGITTVAQEFDGVLTDGKRLFIIECKAGGIRVGHVYKLENCVRNYGGAGARGVLVSAFRPPYPSTMRRLDDASNLELVVGEAVTSNLRSLVAPGS
jgi:hypothetical protein